MRLEWLVFAFIICTTLMQTHHAEELKIHILTLSEIRACFYDATRKRGICVLSTPSSVHIKNMDDEDIMNIIKEQKHDDESLQSVEHKLMIDKLIQSEDIKLVEEMAHALGDQGIYGNVYPSVLPFYILAVRLSTTSYIDPAQHKSTKKGFLKDVVLSKRSASTCQPKPNPDHDCLGMCGNGCSCWEFVCGDCCWHKGCYEHDMCCRKSFYSKACFDVFDITCDGFPKYYPKCLE